MISDVRLLKALADENRLRLLLLLQEKELFVCQLMAVTGLSQSLVSRSLALLEREGMVASRRQGKNVFYRWSEAMPPVGRAVMDELAGQGAGGRRFMEDRRKLQLFCRRFQKGKACDMAMVREFLAYQHANQCKESQ